MMWARVRSSTMWLDGPQVDDLLHVVPTALDFQQLLVAEHDVLGTQAGVVAAQEVLPIEVLLP